MKMNEYLIKRFLRNNVRKYHKYCMDWVNKVTSKQMQYFEKEKERLGL